VNVSRVGTVRIEMRQEEGDLPRIEDEEKGTENLDPGLKGARAIASG
jgi:hypothetical protein